MRLCRSYFEKDSIYLAKDLLGKLICTNFDGNIKKYRITETEAYYGEEDTACHAHEGKTNRTEVMYMEGGVLYIYLCYGIHNLLNIVTGQKDHPEAVLIRGISEANGPGKATKFMNIDRKYNKLDITLSDEIWIEDDGYKINDIYSSGRIGIGYASKEDQERQWRFYIKDK